MYHIPLRWCQSHQGLQLQLHTEDREGEGNTLSTVGEQRGRERRGVGWGRDGHTQVDTQAYRHKLLVMPHQHIISCSVILDTEALTHMHTDIHAPYMKSNNMRMQLHTCSFEFELAGGT